MHKILLKYPSRSRPERFFEGLDSIYNNISEPDGFHVACSLDIDDMTMNNMEVRNRISLYKNISVQWGLSENKVHAINRDMPDYDFDILICMSDDIRFQLYGFDYFIRAALSDSLDLHLHIPDQDEKDKLPVLYIAGKMFYDRFGFVYDPAYKSLFCDTEMMEIAKELARYKYEHIPGLFVHLLPAYGHLPSDEQWETQQRIGWTEDQKTYLERKSKRQSNPGVLNDWIDAYKNDSL